MSSTKPPRAVCHHPPKLIPTTKGKEVYYQLRHSQTTYKEAGIDFENWVYLAYLVGKGFLYTESLELRYGTAGKESYQKLEEQGYAVVQPGYTS